MKQINLLEILIKHIPTELYDSSLDKYYLAAMRESCENTVDLCLMNVQTIHDEKLLNELSPGLKSNDLIYKPSILDIKDLII